MKHRSTLLFVLAGSTLAAPADAGRGRIPPAPPPPVVEEADHGAAQGRRPFRADPVLYSHGDPTGEEQLFMELMNRARLDPDAEADRIFDDYDLPSVTAAVNYFIAERPGVEYTRSENRTAWRSYAAQPPFAFNANLLAAARAHTQLMKERDVQSHQVSGEPALGARVTAAGYAFAAVGESVFAYADDMLDGHAGFSVDWGQPVPAMETRPSLGHRDSLINFSGTRNYTEAGVGVVADSSAATQVGPRLITIDFGRSASSTDRFVTGVCWQDQDGDGFYDPGEGIPGVRIESAGSSYYAVSSASGGYALPFPPNAGAVVVTTIGTPGTASEVIGTQNFNVTMAGANVKLDVSVPADPPVPEFQAFEAVGPYVLDGASHSFQVNVPDIEGMDAPAAVELDLVLTDPALADAVVTLRSPSGTTVTLYDGEGGTGGLTGVFPRSLAASNAMTVFAGEDARGDWTLGIGRETGSGNGSLGRFAVRVRPSWPRPLASPSTNLDVVKATWTAGTGGLGSLQLVANVDAGGAAVGSSPALRVVWRPEGGDDVVVDFAGAAPGVTGKVTPGIAGTSKSSVKVKWTGLDLPAAPASVRIDVFLGGALVSETVPLAAGRYKASTARPTTGLFSVDSVRSTLSGPARTTVVKGRMFGPATVTGLVELVVGTSNGKIAADSLTMKGTKHAGKASGPLAKVTYDTATGLWSAKFTGGDDILDDDGLLRIGLRIGDRYAEDVVRPSVSGDTIVY